MATETTVPTNHRRLLHWVDDAVSLCEPDDVHWCDGSADEYDRLCRMLVDAGTFERLSDAKRPNSYLALSDPGRRRARRGPDVHLLARPRTTPARRTTGATRDEMRALLEEKFRGSMRGRTMYVVPFSMGPLGSPIAEIGVAADRLRVRGGLDADHDPDGRRRRSTSSATTATSCRACTRPARRSPRARRAVAWPCNEEKYIVHFPETREIWSYGSGYGGNALLGKKCFALRIASVMARDEGWLAEHMLILKLTSPEGEVKYVTGAFPSACGKTNLAMLIPAIDGWKVETIGDDIAWMKFGDDGRLYAINPEAGFFGVAPGHEREDEPERDEDGGVELDLHQLREDRRRRRLVGGDDRGAARAPDRLARRRLDARTSDTPAAHPNARFTAPAAQDPAIAPEWDDPAGVPIDAFLFGGRRSTVVPLVHEAYDWEHGVFLGSIMGSETTAAQASAVGKLRRDPFAMLPFCGYHMGDYFAHWLELGRREGAVLPKVFYVNWFRKDLDDGRYLWPGFGENARVLAWVFRRCDDAVEADDTPIGRIPTPDGLDTDGLDISDEDLAELLAVDPADWREEIAPIREFYGKFGASSPPS